MTDKGHLRSKVSKEDRDFSVTARINQSAAAFQISCDLYAATGSYASRNTAHEYITDDCF